MKRCTQLSSYLCRFNSPKCLMMPVQRKYYTIVQKNIKAVSNGFIHQKHTRRYVQKQNPLQEIMNTIPPESDALSPMDTLNIFRSLSEAKQKLPPDSSFDVSQHKNFAILRDAMKASFPYFHSRDKFEAIKSFQSLSIPLNDDVFLSVISSLHEDVFNMSLNEIMLFDAVLTPNRNDTLVYELRASFIQRFNAKMSQMPVDFSYFIHIRRMLIFISKNRKEIADEVFVNIRECTAEVDIFAPAEAMDVIIQLSNFGNQCEYFEKILDKAFDVWHTGEVTIEMVETVLALLTSRKSKLNYELYNDTRLIEKCAQVAIQHGDLDKAFAIQRNLSRLRLSSRRLIDFLLNQLKEGKSSEVTVHKLFALCIACDIANYRPPVFDEFLVPTLANMNLHQQFDVRINWAKFAMQLHHYGIYHKELIDEVLKQKTVFEPLDEKIFAELEILKMKKMLQVDSPLGHLKTIIGDDHLRCLVHANDEVIIPIVLKIDVHSKCFAPFLSTENESIHSYQCDSNQCLVGIIDSSTQEIQSLRPDMVTIAFDSFEWSKILELKDKQALFTEIFERVENQKVKQKLTDVSQ